MGVPVVSFLFNIRPFISLDFTHLLIFWLTFPHLCAYYKHLDPAVVCFGLSFPRSLGLYNSLSY